MEEVNNNESYDKVAQRALQLMNNDYEAFAFYLKLDDEEKDEFLSCLFEYFFKKEDSDINLDDSEYLNILIQEFSAKTNVKKTRVQMGEIKDEIQKLEEEKAIQEDLVNKSLSEVNTDRVHQLELDKKELMSLQDKKDKLDEFIRYNLKQKEEGRIKDDLVANMSKAHFIAAYDFEYAIKSMAMKNVLKLPVLILLIILLVDSISLAINNINVLSLVGCSVLFAITSVQMCLFINSKCHVEYYDARWLKELRDRYLQKTSSRENELIEKLKQAESTFDVMDEVDDIKEQISDIQIKIDGLQSNYNSLDEECSRQLAKVDEYNLQREIMLGRLENEELISFLKDDEDEKGKTLQKTYRKSLGGK